MIEALEGEIRTAMAAARVPGLALAAVRGREVVYAGGFGVTSTEADGEPVTAETLFRIGSIGKPLTGTLVMALAGAGVLDLDRPIGEYVPWLRLSDPETTARLTLRHLLTHTSGLPHRLQPEPDRDAGQDAGDDTGQEGLSEDERTAGALDDLVRRRLPGAPLIAPLGTALSYSTTGISLAGYVAQVVCGAPYPAVARRWLLDPLEMRRTTWDRAGAAGAGLRIALGHDVGPGGDLRPVRHYRSEPCYRPAGTDTLSSALDLANFVVIHLDRGRFRGRAVLAPEAVAAMHALHAETHDIRDDGHGLTFVLDTYRGVRRVGHGGASGAFGSFLRFAPDRGAGAAIVYSRRQQFVRVVDALLDRVFDRLLDLPDQPPSGHERARPDDPDRAGRAGYAGTYAGWWTGLATVREEDGRLTLEVPQKLPAESGAIRLERVRRHVYRGRWPDRSGQDGGSLHSVGFVSAGDGPAPYIKIDGLLCERLEAPPAGDAAPDDVTRLEPLAGRYDGPRDVLTVRVRDGRLWIHSLAAGEEVPCAPADATRFACRWGLVAFLRQDGAVVALRVGQVPLSEPFTYRRVG